MNADIFQSALAATARIACCAVLVSCKKTPTPNNQTTEPAEQKNEQAVEKPTTEETPTKKETSTTETEEKSDDIRITVETQKPSLDMKKCDAQLEEYFQTIRTSAHILPSKELEECCFAVLDEKRTVQQKQTEQGLPAQSGMLDKDCCRIVNFQYPGCTPWGPPMPPQMV